MKKRKLLLPCVVCVFAMLAVVSCKKGDAGPAGPAGEPGQQGQQGPQGNAGSANVIYSEWMDVTFDVADTVHNTDGSVDTTMWSAEIPADRLTADYLTNAEIKVYMNVNTADDPVVFPLPLTDVFALTGVLNINVFFQTGAIELYSTEDASTFIPNGGTAKAWQFRYVIIPGGTAARSAKSIDWNNYAAVKTYLGLKN